MIDKHLISLSLPNIPKDIENELIQICKNVKINHDRWERYKSHYEESLNIAAQEYNTERVGSIPKYITDEIQDLYEKYFYGGIFGFLGKTVNLNGGLGVLPPHCDSQRRVAINYLLEAGGSNVQTTLYKEKRKVFNLNTIETLNYNEVNIKAQTVIPVSNWHIFNAQRYHSVENIETERYYFSLALYINPSFKEFKKQYKHLIV